MGGAMINNMNCKNHTLNLAMKFLLSANPRRFDLDFIQKFIDMGAKPCNNQDSNHNTLSRIITHTKHTNKNQDMNVINKINQIKFLSQRGAESDNSFHSTKNSLILAIKTHCPQIVKIICDAGALPINIHSNISKSGYFPWDRVGSTTLYQAVKTKNAEIVRHV